MTPWRARAGLAAGALAWLATGRLLVTALVHSPLATPTRAVTLDDALAAIASVLGLVALAWLALIFAVTAVSLVLPAGSPRGATAQRLGSALAPRTARRALAVALAAALVSGTTPARAAAPPAGVTGVAVSSDPVPGAPFAPGLHPRPAGLDPGWGSPSPPSRAPSPPPSPVVPLPVDPSWGSSTVATQRSPSAGLDPSWGSPARARPGVPAEDWIVVRRGDSLWDLAARHLGPAATDAEIAHAWPLWYAANRPVIGPDPDRLTPGQRLRPPHRTEGGPP